MDSEILACKRRIELGFSLDDSLLSLGVSRQLLASGLQDAAFIFFGAAPRVTIPIFLYKSC